jgi:CxxC motif-containing protein
MKKNFVCIVCPSSCRLTVSDDDGEITVTGNTCKRGLEHGISEFTNPMRMLTSTIAISGGTAPRLSVISTGELPKAKLGQALELVYKTQAKAPIKCGDILIENICGTGADIIASRSMKEANQ